MGKLAKNWVFWIYWEIQSLVHSVIVKVTKFLYKYHIWWKSGSWDKGQNALGELDRARFAQNKLIFFQANANSGKLKVFGG